MGLLDKLLGKKKEEKKEEKVEESEEDLAGIDPNAKYADEICGYCGNAGCDKKFAGKYFHKQCIRSMKKEAKGMVR